MDAGLLDEASDVLLRALKSDTVHQNVALAKTRLDQMREEQAKKLARLRETGPLHQQYFTGFAEAWFQRESLHAAAGNWRTDDGLFTISVMSMSDGDVLVSCGGPPAQQGNGRSHGGAVVLAWQTYSPDGYGGHHFAASGRAYCFTRGEHLLFLRGEELPVKLRRADVHPIPTVQ